MISHLRGKITRISPTEMVIEAGGVGYQVNIPLSTYEKFNKPGTGEITVLTYLQVREDAMTLYGFGTEAERDLFKQLISVSGVGPKIAQGILSGIGANQLREAITSENVSMMTSISGVGRKTAERIILELKNKLGKMEFEGDPSPPSSHQLKARSEAVIALMSLGFNRQSAEQAVNSVMSDQTNKDLSVEELIKTALHLSAAKQR